MNQNFPPGGQSYSSSSRGMMPPHMPPNMPPNMPPQNMPPYMPPNMHPQNKPYNMPQSNTNEKLPIQNFPQQNPGAMQMQGGNSCFAELNNINEVEIRQSATCLDYFCSRCTDNEYNVFLPDSEKKLYEFKEDETGLCEQCCCYKCHRFKMKINNLTSPQNSLSVTLEGEKKFAAGIMFNCCGCSKPSMPIEVKTPQGFILGKANMNFSSCCCACCSSKIEIIDNGGNVKYIVKGNCCCPVGCYYDNNCSKCCSCSYNVIKDEQEVGIIKKKCCSSCRTFCTKAVDYLIAFPPQATPEEKMLIIIGAILLDSQSYYL